MKATDILKNNKLRVTPLRIALLEILQESKAPLSYDKILRLIKANKTTIYRNFELFEKQGIVIKSEQGRKSFYEFGSGFRGYFVCDVCHKVLNINLPTLKEAKSIKSAVLKGVCNTCS